MHRLRAAAPRDIEDDIPAQIGLRGGCGADGIGLIRLAHMQRLRIGLAEDGDGLDAHAPRGADDADGDLATIGDEDFREHAHHIRNRPKRVGGMGACSAALKARPSTSRVMAGGMMPSSQRRAVA